MLIEAQVTGIDVGSCATRHDLLPVLPNIAGQSAEWAVLLQTVVLQSPLLELQKVRLLMATYPWMPNYTLLEALASQPTSTALCVNSTPL